MGGETFHNFTTQSAVSIWLILPEGVGGSVDSPSHVKQHFVVFPRDDISNVIYSCFNDIMLIGSSAADTAHVAARYRLYNIDCNITKNTPCLRTTIHTETSTSFVYKPADKCLHVDQTTTLKKRRVKTVEE